MLHSMRKMSTVILHAAANSNKRMIVKVHDEIRDMRYTDALNVRYNRKTKVASRVIINTMYPKDQIARQILKVICECEGTKMRHIIGLQDAMNAPRNHIIKVPVMTELILRKPSIFRFATNPMPHSTINLMDSITIPTTLMGND